MFANTLGRSHELALEKEKVYYRTLIQSIEKEKDWEPNILKAFNGYLRRTFSGETSINLQKWREDNPTFGQCGIATLITQRFFGGEIIEADIPIEWRPIAGFSTHIWNRIRGRDVDFTREQFPREFPYDDLVRGRLGEVRTRSSEDILTDYETAVRFERATERMKVILFEKTQ